MHAKEQNLVQLLEGSKQYLVPLYQRTYSWQRTQIDQLWRDALSQAEVLESDQDGPGHFLGSLVLAPSKSVVGGASRWLVVDGQQRLTTLSLALCALRDHVRDEDARIADRIHRQFLINEYLDGAERPKLIPTQSDRAAYYAILEGDPGEAVGNIGDTYRAFRELLIAFDDPEDPYDLVKLERALTHRLDLVAITADADDNVHRIFESLNNTGMRLTQGDLLRNYLFMLLPTQADQVYREVWQPLEKRLGAENLETLAYLDLLVQGYERANRGDTYRGQTERVRPFENDEDAVISDLIRLSQRAESLTPILDPSKETDPKIRSALQRLQDWGGESTWPIMLVAIERFRAETATRDQVLDVALYLESYLVRRMLTGRSAAGVNRALIQIANDIQEQADIADAVRRALSNPRRFWATDDQVREAVATRNFYWSGRGAQRLFILRRIEEADGHKEAIDWQQASPTIEHVMPQTPGPEWLDGLIDPDDQSLPPTDVHAAWVHRLGNLTLTSYNPELSAHPFPQKRERYRDSNFVITRRIADRSTWRPVEIQQRGQELAEQIIKIWPGPLELGPPVHDDPWRVARQVLVALPEGMWTTYGDVSAVTGTSPVALGQFLAGSTVPNAWRVLTSAGRVSEGFSWSDDRDDDPVQLLASEGVRISDTGVADPRQRLHPPDLAELLGIAIPGDLPELDDVENPDRSSQFWIQLQANHDAGVAEGVRTLMDAWIELGGTLTFGTAAHTSMFFMLRSVDPEVWPWVIYPGRNGTVEIAFQYLKARPPFDDTAAREQMRQLLNRIPEVHIDPARISLRPSISIDLVARPEVVASLVDVATWFVATALGREAE